MNTRQVFIIEKSPRKKKSKFWSYFSFFLMLKEAWLCEQQLDTNFLKCDHRTGILSFSAARAEQLFVLAFQCGTLLYFNSSFTLILPVLCYCCDYPRLQVINEVLNSQSSMLDIAPTERLWLLKTYAIKPIWNRASSPFLVPLSTGKSCHRSHETQNTAWCILRLLCLFCVFTVRSLTNAILFLHSIIPLIIFLRFLVVVFCL